MPFTCPLPRHKQGLKDAPSHVSYRFGYIAGDRENPQSRHEVSYEPGYVTGAYSFVDANNKLQVSARCSWYIYKYQCKLHCNPTLFIFLEQYFCFSLQQYVKYEAHPEHGFCIVDQCTKDAASVNPEDQVERDEQPN